MIDHSRIPILLKFIKQVHKGLVGSSNHDIFNTIADIKIEITNDDFLSLYLNKINATEKLLLYFSIYLYHRNNDAAKSLSEVLKNLKSYQFMVLSPGNYKLEECGRCMGYGREECDYCGGSGEEECRECDGNGKEMCDSCDGDGEIDGEVCDECGGSGDLTCSSCAGQGTESCHYCGGDGYYDCDKCNNSGEIETDEQLIDEEKDLVYTLNNLDLIFDENDLVYENVYKSRVLQQPYIRQTQWQGEVTMDDVQDEYDLENLDLSKGYIAIYWGEKSI